MDCNKNSFSKPDVIPVLDFELSEIMQARDKGNILSLDLEITEACNCACVYCYRYESEGAQPPAANELSAQEIIELLTEAKEKHDLRRICILGGEPLIPVIREKYIATLECCNRLGIEHVTFTNGVALDKETAQLLYDLNASVCLKLNGMNAQTHDALVARSGAFDKSMSAFNHLIELGFGNKRSLSFETVVTKTNYNQITDMWRWARERNIVPYVETLTVQGRSQAHPNDLVVSNEKLHALFVRLNEIDHAEYGLEWEILPPIAGGHRCLRYYMSMYVRANGIVCPCVGVDLQMGSLRTDSIKEILSSEVACQTRYINEHITGKCKTCDLAKSCYGCRGAAYQQGDLFGEDPVCWREQSNR
ncbi:radical SAM protein [Halodesulfovibrio aestuarii]|uniref:Radical SAM/SPASM domain-containing protein n=1 Tax=Halodesulfovibrio aestuarii TaxID=126333 RepID=A0ABV4JNE4_9BACT